jgi:hypothetical protein
MSACATHTSAHIGMISLNAEGWFVVAGIVLAAFRSRRVGTTFAVARSGAKTTDVLALAAIALALVAVFGWMARSYFLSDDFILLQQARAFENWGRVFLTPGGDGFFRPLGYVSYPISAKWAGLDPAAWHWIGFGLHFLNAALVYALAVGLGYSRFLAWVAGTLFAVHGGQPEAALWIAGRFDLLSSFFFLVALLVFLKWRESGIWLVVAVVAMTAGLLCKESAYSFPLVVALLVLCGRRYGWGPALLFGALTAALFAYRWHLLGGIGGYGAVTFLGPLKAVGLRMWAILFFPVNWTLPGGAWLTALAIIYGAAWARLFFVRAELRRIAFALGFMILTALPAVSQLLIGADLEKARVLYLPSVGFCLFAAALLEPIRPPTQVAFAAILILFQGTVLCHNLTGWRKASEVVEAACETAARCSARPIVTGLPRTLHGVYTFANGFPECVAMQTPPGQDGAACTFTWDATSSSLKAIR